MSTNGAARAGATGAMRRMRRMSVVGVVGRMPRAVAVGAALVVLAVLSALLTGCAAGRDDDAAQRVADWVAAQPHVLSASGSAASEYDTILTIGVDVDPSVSEQDLTRLVHDVNGHAEGAGWGQAIVSYELGRDRGFSNLGGEPTFQVFLGIWHDPRFVTASARGAGEGAPFHVTVPQSEVGALEASVDHLVELAEAAGGVQTNLSFAAATDDGRYTVTRTYDEPAADAVALWHAVEQRFALDQVWALAIETGAQVLNLHVADAATQEAVELFVAAQSSVDVRVYVTGADTG